MACDISNGRPLSCKEGAAGLLAIYLLNKPIDISYDTTDPNLIDDITTDGTTAITAYKYELDHTGAKVVENINAGRDNGTKYYEQVVTAVLQGIEEEDIAQIDQLAKGRPAVIAHYRNGKARLYGATRGFDTSGNNDTGGALGDFQGYNLTLTAQENTAAKFLKDATENDPFAGLTTTPTVDDGTS